MDDLLPCLRTKTTRTIPPTPYHHGTGTHQGTALSTRTAGPSACNQAGSEACRDKQPSGATRGGEQIFQLCLSGLNFKGCAWVWERIKRVCQSTCKSPHCCPNCQTVTWDRSTRPHLPLPTLVNSSNTQWHTPRFTSILSVKQPARILEYTFLKLNIQCS